MVLFHQNFSKETDEELMSLLTRGGQSAFDELYCRYSKPLLNFFFRMLNNDRKKAEDMLHDLFLKIIEHPESFDCTRTFSTWFYTLAGNMIKNEYRNRSVQQEFEQQCQDKPTETNSDINAIDRQLFNKQLKLELSRLDPESELLFNMRFTEEMSIKQIANMLEYPEGTVKSRLFYITRQLAKKLAIYKPELN
ncbi:MAG: polymerase, sigma-24 subunit, subfamily [Bacteroidetes bacterium]|nr:polymerase, sigma-24 subunit, subfamily [Bacteroidota bacterium]